MKKNSSIDEIISQFVSDNRDELICHRRWFHQHPETSFKELETSNYIQKFLSQIGIKKVETIAETGVICEVGNGKMTHACRFNMDGLPIREKNKINFCSIRKGYSHSCGHDFELAWGLMIAQYFQK